MKTYDTTFTVEVRVHLLLEGGLIEVPRPNSDTESNGLLLGLSGDILPDGNTGVDTTALLEESSDGASRAFWSYEDDIDIGRGDNVGIVLVDNREAMREVKGLALGDQGCNLGPGLRLGGIGEEVHDDRSTVNCFFDWEKSFSGHLDLQ